MIVADTNLIAYLLIAGPFSESAQAVFDRDGKWLAPTIWHHELLNVLATSVRKEHLSHETVMDVWAHAPAFVKDAEVPPLKVLDLSISSNFATFDCYYVVLARSLALPLVTADKKMLKAFADVAVSIEEFARGN
jgi:predicted nucleic acid-binding protein